MPTCGTAVPRVIYLSRRESRVGSTYHYVLGQRSIGLSMGQQFYLLLESCPVKRGWSSILSDQQLSAKKDWMFWPRKAWAVPQFSFQNFCFFLVHCINSLLVAFKY